MTGCQGLLKPMMAAVVKMAIQTLVEILAEVTVEMRLKMAVKAMEMRILMLRRRVFWLPLMSSIIGPYPSHTLYCAALISPSKDCEGQSRTSDTSQDPRHLILPPIERVEISTEHMAIVPAWQPPSLQLSLSRWWDPTGSTVNNPVLSLK